VYYESETRACDLTFLRPARSPSHHQQHQQQRQEEEEIKKNNNKAKAKAKEGTEETDKQCDYESSGPEVN
jgi:hypothetical protein